MGSEVLLEEVEIGVPVAGPGERIGHGRRAAGEDTDLFWVSADRLRVTRVWVLELELRANLIKIWPPEVCLGSESCVSVSCDGAWDLSRSTSSSRCSAR